MSQPAEVVSLQQFQELQSQVVELQRQLSAAPAPQALLHRRRWLKGLAAGVLAGATLGVAANSADAKVTLPTYTNSNRVGAVVSIPGATIPSFTPLDWSVSTPIIIGLVASSENQISYAFPSAITGFRRLDTGAYFQGANGLVASSNNGLGGAISAYHSSNGYGISSYSEGDNAIGLKVRTSGANSKAIVVETSGTDAKSAELTGAKGVTTTATGGGGTGLIGNGGDGGNGVIGECNSTNGYGVWGKAVGTNAVAIRGSAGGTGALAGQFSGSVAVQGTLSKTGGTFKIDHPLDPANKYLYHSFVESPDMKNIYDGIVTLDEKGEATVQLPDWFSALNRDLRYQLTPLGQSAPNIYIKQTVKDLRFVVAGGAPGQQICWQVTGNRQDAYALAYPVNVEEKKSDRERGTYLHPEVHGQPPELGVHCLDKKM